MPLLNMFGGKDKSKRRDEYDYDDEYDSRKRRSERGRRSEDDYDSKRERERSQSKYRTRHRSKSRDERRRSRSERRRSKSRSKSVVSSRGKSRMRSRSVVSTKSVDKERRKKDGTSTRRRRSRSADTLTSILRNGKNSERRKTQRGRDDALREEEASIRSKSRHRRRSKSVSSARSKRDKSRSRPKGDRIDGESRMRSSSVRSKGMSCSSSRMSRRYRDDEEEERYRSRREEERNLGRSKSRISRRDDESTSGRSRRSKSRGAKRDEDEKSVSKRSKSRRSRREEDEKSSSGRSTRSKSRMMEEDDEYTSTRSRRDGDETMSGLSAIRNTERLKQGDTESVSGMSTASKGKQQSILRNSQSSYQSRAGVVKSCMEKRDQSRESEEKIRPLAKPVIDESPRQSVKDLAQKLHNKVEQSQENDRINPQSVRRENAPWKSLNPNGLSNIHENPNQQEPQENKRTPPTNTLRALNMKNVRRNSINSSTSSSIEARSKQVPQSQEQRFSISCTGQTTGNSSSISGRSTSSHGSSKWRCQACSNINLISQGECMNCGKQNLMQNNIVSQVPPFTGTRRKLVRSNSNTSISTISLSNSVGQSFSNSQNSSSRSRQMSCDRSSTLVVNVPTCSQQPVTISSNRITSPLSARYQNRIKSSTIVVDAAKIPRQPWRCSCGNMNESTRSSCMNCGMSPSVSVMPNRVGGQSTNMETASLHSCQSNQFTHGVYQPQQLSTTPTTVPTNILPQTTYGNHTTYNSNESVASQNKIVSLEGNGWLCSQCAASNFGAGNFCSSCGAKKLRQHLVASEKGFVDENNPGAPQDMRAQPIQEPICRPLTRDLHDDTYRSNEDNETQQRMGNIDTHREIQPQLNNANASHQDTRIINSDTRKKKGKGTGAPNIKKSVLSSNVLTDIVSGNIELKPPPKPSNEENSPRNLSIFDQIKMGKNLKKATERELAPKPRRPISIMDEIKIGVDLKKVASSDPIDDPKKGFMHGVLAARRKLVGSSKDESIRSIDSHDW